MKITESKLQRLITESVREVINEAKESTIATNKLIKRLYNGINKITGSFFKDDDWNGVNIVLNRIEEIIGDEGELDVWCENGGYAKPITEEGNYKTWKLKITLYNGGIIGGELNANAAGTSKNPFGRYDITCGFWRETYNN